MPGVNRPDQAIDDWSQMLHSIYGHTQNYGKSEFELFAHTAEVCGAFGKYLFKKRQPDKAVTFLPKMFAWPVALAAKVRHSDTGLRQLTLEKYPGVCAYCAECPCICWNAAKPAPKPTRLRDIYYHLPAGHCSSLNDLQRMFREIYEPSWAVRDLAQGSDEAYARLSLLYSRLIEELSELGEAVRFYHLYRSNFDNELADFLARWFAITSSLDKTWPTARPMFLAEDVLWSSYPGFCKDCLLSTCDCRPAPVRELLSKPSLTELALTDPLTKLGNREAYNRDIAAIEEQRMPLSPPIACIRLDIDNFKSINDNFSHSAGDDALNHIAAILRQKLPPRDRIYRWGGDEFAVLCPDFSSPEAVGLMQRVHNALRDRVLVRLDKDNLERAVLITVSVGASECHDPKMMQKAMLDADTAAARSKAAGKARTTVFAERA